MAILTVPREDELDALAKAYDLGAKRFARGIEAGTVNTSYVIELDAGRYFLRLYEEQDRAGAEAEAALLLHLAASGVLTPAPVVGRDGQAVRMVAGKPAALFPWVEGDMLCLPRVTPAAAETVGSALARVHLAGPAPTGPTLGTGRFGAPELEARCARVALSADPQAAACGGALRDALLVAASARATNLPTGLIHGDLFRDNVLWHEGRIAALLDFESASRGPFAYDIAVTILSWSFRDTFDHAIGRALLAGYQQVRPLERSEREALFGEAVFAALRFTITRITDNAVRVGKRWQRFVARREALEQLGPAGLREALGL